MIKSLIIHELIILLMNTVRDSSSVNMIVFRWILTSSDGLMNSISINHEVNEYDSSLMPMYYKKHK
jgi:hypothetical protein